MHTQTYQCQTLASISAPPFSLLAFFPVSFSFVVTSTAQLQIQLVSHPVTPHKDQLSANPLLVIWAVNMSHLLEILCSTQYNLAHVYLYNKRVAPKIES